jgi:iron complex transport system substrate-binding protein
MRKLLFIIIAAASSAALSGKEILLFGGSQPLEWLIRGVAPESLCALNLDLSKSQKLFFASKHKELAVIGGFNKGGLCMETLLKIHPQYVLVSDSSKVKSGHMLMLKKANIQLVRINIKTLNDYPEAFEKIAALAGKTERGKELSHEYSRLLKELKRKTALIKPDNRKKVYYAAGSNGLISTSGLSGHALVLAYAGAKNVINSKFTNGRRIKISFEKLMAAEPDVIIIRNKSFYGKIKKMPGWRDLKAVKTGNYYLIPDTPVNWFDMPHTYMQLAGAWWLASILYPQEFDEDIKIFTKKINKLFFNIELNDEKTAICEKSKGRKC